MFQLTGMTDSLKVKSINGKLVLLFLIYEICGQTRTLWGTKENKNDFFKSKRDNLPISY